MMDDPRLHPLMQGVIDTGALGPYPRGMVQAQQPTSPYQPPAPQYGQRFNSPYQKSTGYYGEIPTAHGMMTEWGMGGTPGVPQYPSIVPGMTGKELDAVRRDTEQFAQPTQPPFKPPGMLIPDVTLNRAENHAHERMAQGKPTFWESWTDDFHPRPQPRARAQDKTPTPAAELRRNAVNLFFGLDAQPSTQGSTGRGDGFGLLPNYTQTPGSTGLYPADTTPNPHPLYPQGGTPK